MSVWKVGNLELRYALKNKGYHFIQNQVSISINTNEECYICLLIVCQEKLASTVYEQNNTNKVHWLTVEAVSATDTQTLLYRQCPCPTD